jgi:uncharacterized protein (TIGR03083 family)
MEHGQFVATIRNQCEALRSSALAAGPEAAVPTCPKWTVSRLVGHLGRVQSWVGEALTDPSGERVQPNRPPEGWAALLCWWDEQRETMIERLADPDAPAWMPFRGYPPTAASWARRQAHEAAIHRLDAEHARAAGVEPGSVPSLVFEPEFAADGIDELICWMVPARTDWTKSTADGVAVLHAADAGQTWVVRLKPGTAPQIGRLGLEGDATIAGTADAVYRRVWGRPSHAVVTGDTTLLEALASP